MLARRYISALALSFPAAVLAQSNSIESFTMAAAASKQPYTATFETKQVQTLADGTTITSDTLRKEGRDSEGRTFHQNTMGLPGQESFTNTVVFRAPEHEVLHWSSQDETVFVQHMGEPEPSNNSKAQLHVPQKKAPVQRQSESLGHKTIMGLDAVGTRETRIIETGAEGNDRPITITTELWRSTDLGIQLESIRDDPRSGHFTTEVKEIERGEPDPSLFQAPKGYTVKDQSATQ